MPDKGYSLLRLKFRLGISSLFAKFMVCYRQFVLRVRVGGMILAYHTVMKP